MKSRISTSPIGAGLGAGTAARPLPHELIGRLPPEAYRHCVLGVEQTAALLNFSVPQLRRFYREKKMPTPLRLGERKLGWKLGVLIDYLQAVERGEWTPTPEPADISMPGSEETAA
ncbi:AlpA family transcriptional regulator [Microvirga sp. VF16]|uniref:helix-turn-helix transcriptional regulator n=1 Tax=Microvirga sp. VF16 TaxID=2807101 RepID=UPI00193D28A0|nr:hypothetical protein [Microvirga sp. VF16]QRM28681.1 hypothetical protein JO965_21010 [Microvirga sp. VF16]